MGEKEKSCFVFSCNLNFIIKEIITIKNLEINIGINDSINKIINPDEVQKFFDFAYKLKTNKIIMGYEMCIVDNKGFIRLMSFCGFEHKVNIIITAFSEEHQNFSMLNNEVINMQRELYKKNAYITDLLNKKEEMNKELEALNSTKDRIFSIIGHDLRSPLGYIISSMQLISKDEAVYNQFKQEGVFDSLKDSAVNLVYLLEDLLDWSKVQLGEISFMPQKYILQDIVYSVLSLFDGVAETKKITIVRKFNDNPIVYVDQRMIATIFRNILSNAIKFSNENSQIVIQIDQESENANITIKDFGTGMKKEKLDTLFNKNISNITYGTSGEKGIGFGLHLCKSLIEKNGGTLAISSEYGIGTNVSFSFPLYTTKKEELDESKR